MKSKRKPGDRFGRLVIQNIAYKKGYVIYFNCLCDCGVVKILSSCVLKGQVSCGCYRNECVSNRVWKGRGELSSSYLSSVRCRARNGNISFGITIDDAWNLFLQQGGKCNLSDLEIKLERSRIGGQQTASLDRIDSSQGYILENMQWVHKDINFIKGPLSQQYFLDLCYAVWIYNQTRKCVSRLLYNNTGKNNVTKSFFNDIECSARRRKISIDLKLEDIQNKFEEQEGKCALTGMQLDFSSLSGGSTGSASLDRIDPNGTYSINNVRFVHKHINTSKLDYNEEYFINLCKVVYEKNLKSY